MIPRDLEGKILGVCVIVILLLLFLWILAGCATEQVTDIDVVCVGKDGGVFHTKMIGADVANDFDRVWDMDLCEVHAEKKESSGKLNEVQ